MLALCSALSILCSVGVFSATTSGSECIRLCFFPSNPVCGSDSVTYDNHCEFMVANCTSQGRLKYTKGPCSTDGETQPDGNSYTNPDVGTCARSCGIQPDYVCGSDGTTYTNQCYFDFINCLFRQQFIGPIYFNSFCNVGVTSPEMPRNIPYTRKMRLPIIVRVTNDGVWTLMGWRKYDV